MNTLKSDNRNTYVDILRIFAMFMIVLGHTRPIDNPLWTNTYFSLGVSTLNPQFFLLSFLGYAGAYGNAIFIICSSYYLTKSKTVNKNKVISLISDNWIISVVFLLGAIVGGIRPDIKNIIISLLPVSYAMNWFVGCYILYYLVHPYLNLIINATEKIKLRNLCLGLFGLYFVLYFLLPSSTLYFNYLIGFICVHFFVGFLKKYGISFMENIKKNAYLCILTFLTNVLIVLFVNLLGLKISVFSDKIGYFSYFNNGLIFLSALSIFNLFRLKNQVGGGRTTYYYFIE